MLKQILEQTAKEAMPEQNQIASNDDSNMSVAVKTAVSNGYTLEQGIEAESILQMTMGEAAASNPDLILNYLMSTYGMAAFWKADMINRSINQRIKSDRLLLIFILVYNQN